MPPEPAPQIEAVAEPLSEPSEEPPVPVSVPSQEFTPEEPPKLYPNNAPQKTREDAKPKSEPAVHAKPQAEAPKVGGAIPPEKTASEAEKEKKRQNVLTRTIWTLIMIGGFIGGDLVIPCWMAQYSLHYHRTAHFGTCLHDCPRYDLPDSRLSGGYGSLFSCYD